MESHSKTPLDRATDSQDLSASLLLQLECPICFDTCSAPIYQCANGHNVCNVCRKKITECGVCRAPLAATTRNWFAEDISARLCALKVKKTLIKDVNIYRCYIPTMPNQQCQWCGRFDEMFSHVVESHPAGYAHCGDNIDLSVNINYDIQYGMLYPRLLSHEGYLFWCMLYYTPLLKSMHVYARLVGDSGQRDKFFCEFAFKNGAHKLLYTQKALCVNEDFRARHKTLQLNKDMIDMFSEGGRIVCEMKVCEKEKEKEDLMSWVGNNLCTPVSPSAPSKFPSKSF